MVISLMPSQEQGVEDEVRLAAQAAAAVEGLGSDAGAGDKVHHSHGNRQIQSVKASSGQMKLRDVGKGKGVYEEGEVEVKIHLALEDGPGDISIVVVNVIFKIKTGRGK